MEKVTTKSHKATLIAAALIITGATAVFGTYAAEDQPAFRQNQPAFAQQRMQLTDEQKTALAEAKELREAGNYEGAKAILDEADIRPPYKQGKSRGRGRGQANCPHLKGVK